MSVKHKTEILQNGHMTVFFLPSPPTYSINSYAAQSNAWGYWGWC